MKGSRPTASLMDQAHVAIKNRILRGEVRLGEPLSRRRLAAELEMSFLPVSLALLRLEYEGFVESRPRAGTRVRVPSREDIRGHYVVREALEVQAARLFVSHATEQDLDELMIMAAQIDALPVGERFKYIRAHKRFHKRIADIAGCIALSKTIEQVMTLESTWLTAVEPPAGPAELPQRRHQELVESLAQRDPERAADGVRAHIAIGFAVLMKGLTRHFAERNRAYVRAYTPREIRR